MRDCDIKLNFTSSNGIWYLSFWVLRPILVVTSDSREINSPPSAEKSSSLIGKNLLARGYTFASLDFSRIYFGLRGLNSVGASAKNIQSWFSALNNQLNSFWDNLQMKKSCRSMKASKKLSIVSSRRQPKLCRKLSNREKYSNQLNLLYKFLCRTWEFNASLF